MDRLREWAANGDSNGSNGTSYGRSNGRTNGRPNGRPNGLKAGPNGDERIGDPIFRVERRSTRVGPRVARPGPGYVGEEVIERVADWRRAAIESDASEGRVGSRGDREDDEPRDSWVDAFVTLLAIVVFGLGWALVELEGADRAANRYVPAVSEMRVAGLEPELGGEPFWSDDWAVGGRADRAESPFEEASWTARAPQNSNR